MLSEAILEACEINLTELRRESAKLFVPIARQPICDWLGSKIRFGRGGAVQLESSVGAMGYENRPWFRFPLECFASNDCHSLALPAATQIGKTANLLIGTMLWAAEFRPAPGMIVMPDELEAKKFRDRVYAIVEASQPFQRIRLQPQHRWNMQEIHLGSMVVHLAWAGSRQRTRGKPCWYVWFSEIDVYRNADQKAGDPIEAGKQRTKDVFRYKHVFESSPSESPSSICDEEAGADERWRWYFACPICGLKQEARFFQHKRGDFAGRGGIELTVKATGGVGDDLMTVKQARDHAYYVCLNGCKITNDRKQIAIESGNWYPRGWNAAKDAEPERKPAKHVGFHLWAINSPNETFGTLAADYLEHVRKGKKIDFYGNRLALAYEAETKIPTWMDLGRRLAWSHARRTVPSDCWFLTAGIDKQGENNGARYVIRGWAPGRTSWLVDWGWIAREAGDENSLILSDLLAVEQAVLRSEFRVVNKDNQSAINPLGKSTLKVKLACIDTNHLPNQIHRWMKSLPEDWIDRMNGENLVPGRIRNIRGDTRSTADVRYRHSLVESNARTGEKYEGGLHLWGVNVNPYYSELTELLSGQPGNIGSWYVTADVLSQGREYLEQVTNFSYSIKHDPRKGKVGSWGPRSAKIPVDFWDCEIYDTVAAEMVVGDLGWDIAAWEKWREKRKPQEQAKNATPRRQVRRNDSDIGAR